MNKKFGKIEKFIESMEIEEINENAQAFLLVGDESFFQFFPVQCNLFFR
jgi:hypothetical protein